MPTTRGTWKVVIGSNTLADYSDVVSRQPITGGPTIQSEPLAMQSGQTEAQFQIARGNYTIQRGMTLTKEFSTNKLSCDWFETAAQTFNGVYDVYITHKDYAGVETTYKITSAAVEVTAEEPIGVSVQASVSIVGGLAVVQVSP